MSKKSVIEDGSAKLCRANAEFFSFRANYQNLINEGWEDRTVPEKQKRVKARDLHNLTNKLHVEYHPEKRGSSGWKNINHYHVHNPDKTNKQKIYLDKNGTPVRKGSPESHVRAGEEIAIYFIKSNEGSPKSSIKSRAREEMTNNFTKSNGGNDKADFLSEHSFTKHKFDPTKPSSKKRTQYGPNMDVKQLREDTIINYDKKTPCKDSLGEQYSTKYEKHYPFNISTSDTPTGSHCVYVCNKVNKTHRSTQFPQFSKVIDNTPTIPIVVQ